MARVSISWDGQTPVEYEGGQEWMQNLAKVINYSVEVGGLAIYEKEYASNVVQTPDGWFYTDPDGCRRFSQSGRPDPENDPVYRGVYSERVIRSKGAGDLQYATG